MSTLHHSLQDKVALITGAASGIGRAMALLFARHGAAVAAVDIDEDGLEALRRQAESEDSSVMGIRADVTNQQDCASAVRHVIEEFQRLDILCNNAGIIRRATVLELEEDEWDHHMAVNVKSVFLWSRAVLPQMLRQGRGAILNTASGWGLTGGARAASYCAAKGAVVQLTRAMAIDHGSHGVRVNCICPGDTDTPMLRDEARQIGKPADTFLEDAATRPLGRIGTPEDIAQAALYLVSDEASFVTGATLVVDGGGLAGS
jgi:NAD(P)-dependent dehydrogenase (short-subunit alcohol dehydrogenase family)